MNRVAHPHPEPARSLGVLLVDDDPYHRTPLLRALRERGHTVLHAADGTSGESLCKESPLAIDALVVCAEMKRMSGAELARRVGRMRPESRVLLMHRHAKGPEQARRDLERGYGAIEEPFTPEDLCVRLAELLASPKKDAWTAERARKTRARPVAREGRALAADTRRN